MISKRSVFASLSSIALLAVSLLSAAPANAATQSLPANGVATDLPYGVDVSWPQCETLLPLGQDFSIIGINNGKANDTNPCLQQQLAWASLSLGRASQPNVALYVNTGNPGFKNSGKTSKWPTANSYMGNLVTIPTRYSNGVCSGKENYDNLACAYMYGWERAYDDANSRGITNPSSYTWWLDVETINSWRYDNTESNVAVLEGMNDYFSKTLGAKTGLYTLTDMWTKITGDLPASSDLQSLNVWYPIGSATRTDAIQAVLNMPSPTLYGNIVMVQYIEDGLDYNYAYSGIRQTMLDLTRVD
jgi:hypothetical protein